MPFPDFTFLEFSLLHKSSIFTCCVAEQVHRMLGVAVVVVAAAAVKIELYDRLLFFNIKTTSNAKKMKTKLYIIVN